MRNTTPMQRLLMGLALAGVLIMTAGLMWLSSRVEWTTLYSNMDARDAQAAAAELVAEKIPSQLDSDGTTLRVPVNLVDKARLGLAAKGLPQSGRIGFELFDKPNWVGSEFDEKVNYQRALEGELEHTISSMGAIASARVHLVLPHDSLFETQQRAAKASVVIKLGRRSLTTTESDSIRTLVASAVDGLDPNDVTLVDADGRVSFGQKDVQTQAALYEQELVDRLTATLNPVAGRDNIRASVNVDFDNAHTDETQEIYDPKGTVLASNDSTDQSRGGLPKVAGVPGTASNAPNGGGAANGTTPPSALPLFPPAVTGTETSHHENTNYFASKRTVHIVQGAGQVKRLTIAILVNDKMVTTGSGKTLKQQFVSRSPEELARIEELGKAAVGFNALRGDQIAVENMAFVDNVAAAPPTLIERLLPREDHLMAAMWWIAPIVMFLLLLIFVFRPVGMQLVQQMSRNELPAGDVVTTALVESEPETEFFEPRHRSRTQVLRQAVAEKLAQEPEPVVRLVKSWITDDEPNE
ncbi:MAG TPA: flagellar basal-body MS-ring/collar protein FliF [Granulicella sp.]|nr:flagellar basal-body MS-ring/collar protein FliF [Granulicella sp.]